MSIKEKLRKAQNELKAPKNQYNKFGKYKYRSAEDILEGVKPVNDKHGLTLTLSDEPVLIGDWHYIKATATLADDKEEISVTAYARESLSKKGMDDSQITGTASSYARKYALNGLYLIDDTKDADTDEHQQVQNNAPKKQDNFAENKKECMKRLEAIAQAYNKPVEDIKENLIQELNNRTNRSDKDITPANIGQAIGLIKSIELKLKGAN